MPDARNSSALQIIDPVLTNVARQYKPEGFVYSQVAPAIPVDTRSGQYPTFSGFFGDDSDTDAQPIDDRAPTPEVSFDWSTDTYLVKDYRLKASITNTERSQANGALRLEQSKLTSLLTRMALRREVRIAAALRATGNGGQLTGGSASPSTKWGAASGSTVEADVQTGWLAVRNKIGFGTNTMVLDEAVALKVASNSVIRDIVKYTIPGEQILVGGSALPPILFGHKPLIAKALRNTAKKGATESLSAVWDDHVRLLYLAEGNGGWGIPSVAYSFTAPVDGAPAGGDEVVDRYHENDPPVDYIRAWEAKTEKVCAPDAGYELYDVIA